jgi:carbamoyl-phosphate synthase small subunit
VRQYQERPSNYRANESLHRYLERAGIVGIDGVDTRALTRHLRSAGVMEGVVSTAVLEPDALLARAREVPGMLGRDLVREVTCAEPYRWQGGGTPNEFALDDPNAAPPKPPTRFHVVAYDYGVKWNLLRRLVDVGAEVTVVPASTRARDALALNPDGVFLSNGPGDPAALPEIVHEVRELLGKKPVFGVCLGHQLMGLALGGRTYKLKFGHRGGNQPVIETSTRRVAVTSQNHGFAVDDAALLAGSKGGARVTHVNLNDRTVEGLAHDGLRCFSVQHHPEAAPGPHDASGLFAQFAEMVHEGHGRR